ncbi:MAG TPA: hypothetical protein VFO41_07750 [Alphaproteobacteria bacterium]|nr:hypothetical protein [Alphaproteobacteria bacterium]
MPLDIQTFSNTSGGSALFKALGHPEAVAKVDALVDRLAKSGKVAVYDPLDQFSTFAALYDLSEATIADVFVQDVEKIGREILGRTTRPVTQLNGADVDLVLVAAFDCGRLVDQIRPLLSGVAVASFDDVRLPPEMLTNQRQYLAPINFATNYAFFRDAGGHHTRLVTANYWGAYGASGARLWATLFDGAGARIATWEQPLGVPNGTVALDSAEIRRRFDLPEFTGQLFLHVIDAAGHDVVKYALDTYGDRGNALSCTHDANAWPSDLYAGLPAPAEGEQVVVWVQNSHPCPIPAGGIGLNLMGRDKIAWLEREVPPFATISLDVRELVPDARWPQQLELQAGKYMVRPRYEITNGSGRLRIAHLNVERTDLKPDPQLKEIGNLMGKGYILPAPILPVERFSTSALPTPMSTAQANLPIAAIVCDADGTEVARHRFGCLGRSDSVALGIDHLLADQGARLPSGHGHVELVYDFSAGGDGDGWLHGIFRYQDRESGHAAETSFGSHMFNTVLTYRNEPQSYAGRPPGLTTRLFLRLGHQATDTMCHLIYPASTPWRDASTTRLTLIDAEGRETADREIRIPCGGSHLFRVSETFDAAELKAAGPGAYVLIRDVTCRLFGYHGLLHGTESFSLDHMFGF